MRGNDWEDLPRELLHHSVHGSTCSASRSGDVWANSAMESFFCTLKKERVYCGEYRLTEMQSGFMAAKYLADNTYSVDHVCAASILVSRA